jgi:hypothetical protein
MPSKKKAQAASYSPLELVNMARTNPYVQRLIEDSKLRENVLTALDSTRSAYTRLSSNGKAPRRALLEDKKLQANLRDAAESFRQATLKLTAPPKKPRTLGIGRILLLLLITGGVALAVSGKLRSKVLDALFGAEEEFDYTPPAPDAAPPPANPVTAA